VRSSLLPYLTAALGSLVWQNRKRSSLSPAEKAYREAIGVVGGRVCGGGGGGCRLSGGGSLFPAARGGFLVSAALLFSRSSPTPRLRIDNPCSSSSTTTFLGALITHNLTTHRPFLHNPQPHHPATTFIMASQGAQAAAQVASKAINPSFNPRTVHFWVRTVAIRPPVTPSKS
jgi:hypothetical protein